MLDDILKEADAIVHGPRNEQYGDPIDDYSKVVHIFRAITGIDLDPEDGALFMVAIKLARLAKSHDAGIVHRDSLVDAAGYLWVYGSIMEAREKPVL